ncbi:hypothetical protein Taro_017881 [Colocasia esculenta]|uniref:Borealin C-terminal domain-containing protein n=1 Tax=Colocasia esculenta TaxID=4460 RepID=A0A843UPB7_COLES|nr:hypothetical protein [Colocasia esculenta]
MGRPRGRKRTIKESPPLVAEPEESAPAAAGEVATERGGFVEEQQLFTDREVQRRIAAIQAIRDAEIENLLSRLRLLRSCLSKEQRKTPALEFFRENFPNLSVVKNEREGIFELEWKDKVGSFPVNHVTERNVLASLDRASTLPSSSALEFSAQSFKMSFLEAASLQIPGSDFEEPSELQFVGSKDVFQTPGVCKRLGEGKYEETARVRTRALPSPPLHFGRGEDRCAIGSSPVELTVVDLEVSSHRLSVGMTPKSLRLPKHGEMLLSVRGSPLGNLESAHMMLPTSSGSLSGGTLEAGIFAKLDSDTV